MSNAAAARIPAFAEFFRAITGTDPFPWQRTLADYVEAHGRFPDTVAAPTGLGKTSVMLVHLHALARDVAIHGVAGRTVPLRCFHAVERRGVVDASATLAQRAADKINTAGPGSELAGVREVLQELIPEQLRGFEPVVAVAVLHGGRAIAPDWLRPVGAQLVCATVTQVASRMLFRGVGVSQSFSPMHAAVTGIDRLVLVDEPQLSVPAITALRHAEKIQRDGQLVADPDGIYEFPTPKKLLPVGQTVMLGATQPAGIDVGTSLRADGADEAHPVAGRRIRAAKSLQLHQAEPGAKALVDELVACALDAHHRDVSRPQEQGGTAGVLVFCNTVATAREVHAQLAKATQKHPQLRTLLVHGRQRGFDRPDRSALGFSRGTVTVTTQALEVGADLDGFEVISQVCSLPALIQRAGRCNRRGEMASAAVVVVAGPEPDKGTSAVYGTSAEGVLTALQQVAVDEPIDFGPAAIPAATQRFRTVGGEDIDPQPTRAASFNAPAARYAAYTATRGPFPTAAYLYGPDRDRNLDVTVAWRHGQHLDLLDDVPVQPAETVDMPIGALMEILTKTTRSATLLDDLDSGESEADTVVRSFDQNTLARVRVRAQRRWTSPASAADISPGSLVVLDCDLGGYRNGVDPAIRDSVTDISADVTLSSGSGAFVLAPELGTEGSAMSTPIVAELAKTVAGTDLPPDSTVADAVTTVSAACREFGVPEAVTVSVLPVAAGESMRFIVKLGGNAYTSGQRDCPTLAEHGHQVGAWAKATAQTIGLPPQLVAALDEAGLHHDDGKGDLRFQCSLSGHPSEPPVAKSRTRSKAVCDKLRIESGLPTGWRHEAASAHGIDDDLIRHLIVSHHRWGRPLLIHPDDPEVDYDGVQVEALTAETSCAVRDNRITAHTAVFDRLTDTYGPWGLALLETVLRWADHRASAHPCPASHRTFTDLQPMTTAARPMPIATQFRRRFPTAEVVPLPGLASSSPLLQILAAAGLLGELTHQLPELQPMLRWNPTTGQPELGGEAGLSTAVASLQRDPKIWATINAAIEKATRVPDILTTTRSPIPANHLPAALPDAHPAATLLLDCMPAEGSGKAMRLQIRLASIGLYNNGAVFQDKLLDGWLGTEAFTDPAAGFTQSGPGLKPAGMEGTIATYPPQTIRAGLLGWALQAQLHLGWAASALVCQGQKSIHLPRPTRWTDLAGYRSLLGATESGMDARFNRSPTDKSDKIGVWVLDEGTQ